MPETPFYVGFGTLEDLIADLRAAGVSLVRVEDISHCGSTGDYGISTYRAGIEVAARVDAEVRYAWITTGVEQRFGVDEPLDVERHAKIAERTIAALERITARLQEQGFNVAKGVYAWPVGMRRMLATYSEADQ